MSREPLLVIDSVSKKFDGQHRYTLKDISFTIHQKELIGIIGESGCGKSSLLNIISRNEQESKGEVRLEGKRLRGPVENLLRGNKEVRLVKQDFDLFPNHTVEEILEYQVRKLLSNEITQKIKWALKFFDLVKAAKLKPYELSGGMQQRLAIAAAMIAEPKVILLDEPFSHLDISRKSNLTMLLLDLVKSTDVAILFVTHDVVDVLRYAHKTFVIEAGKLIQQGSPMVVYDNPVNLKTAKILSEGVYLTPMEAKTFLKLFDIDFFDQKGIYLRSHDVFMQAHSGIKMEIDTCYFQGDGYLVLLNFLTKKISIKSEFEAIPGQYLEIYINKDKIIYI